MSKEQRPHLVSLGFKVQFEFRQRFKIRAARAGLSMTELLLSAFDAWEREASTLRDCEPEKQRDNNLSGETRPATQL